MASQQDSVMKDIRIIEILKSYSGGYYEEKIDILFLAQDHKAFIPDPTFFL